MLLLKFIQHHGVLAGVCDDCNVLPVFGCTSHHGRAANVDVFYGVFQTAVWIGNCSFKRIEVDHQDIDGADAVVFQSLHMRGNFATGEQARMHQRVQGFDTAIEHLWKARELCHLKNGQTLGTQQLRGTPGGNQLYT